MAMAPGKIRLGVAPIAWSNSDLPELGGETSLETCLKESREAGFSGTETGVKFPMDAAVLGPVLAEYQLQLVSGWFSGRLLEVSVEEEKRRVEAQLACYKALGAPVIIYAETTGSLQADQGTPVSRRQGLAPADFADYGRKLTEFAEYLQAAGVPMSYHPHMGTVIETDQEIDLLMANTGPAVGLLIDSGHVVYAGGDPVGLVRRHAKRLNHIHCKDIRGPVLASAKQNDLSFLDAILAGVFTVPGDGMIDFHAFAAALADAGYGGWVVVEAEQDPAKAPPLQYAAMGFAHLTDAFSAAGYTILP
ncbi:MAG: myo-inosose-2 dehydratase [Alphaproteobacteria bacterium]